MTVPPYAVKSPPRSLASIRTVRCVVITGGSLGRGEALNRAVAASAAGPAWPTPRSSTLTGRGQRSSEVRDLGRRPTRRRGRARRASAPTTARIGDYRAARLSGTNRSGLRLRRLWSSAVPEPASVMRADCSGPAGRFTCRCPSATASSVSTPQPSGRTPDGGLDGRR